MLNLKRLETVTEIQSLKKGSTVIVEWKEGSSEYKRGNKVGIYKRIWGINRSNEVILELRRNIYFSIDMYLSGESVAKAAYVIKGEEQ